MHIFSPLPSKLKCFPLSHISLYSTVNHYNQLPCPFLNPPYSPGQTAIWLNPAPLLLPPAPAQLDSAGEKICKHADWFHLKLIISHQEEL